MLRGGTGILNLVAIIREVVTRQSSSVSLKFWAREKAKKSLKTALIA